MKPGQLCTINNVVYRAKKRTYGCTGCALNSIDMCPEITDFRSQRKINCDIHGIILIRVP